MEKLKRISKRVAGLIIFALLSFAAVLYGLGRFDLVFLSRDLPISGRGSAVIDTPPLSEDDKELQNHIGQMGVGENLSDVISGGNKGEDSSTAGEKDPSDSQGSTAVEYYPSYEQAEHEGYYLTNSAYGKESILAEIIFDTPLTRDQIKGTMLVFEDVPVTYEDGGESFYAVGEIEDYRFSVEPYMGYLLISDSYTVSVYNSIGHRITSYGHSELRPAYVRDVEGNPLFLDATDRYFLLGEDGRKLYSGYVDETDSKGVYFDYDTDFGVSDNELVIYSRNEDVHFIDEIDMSDYYIRSSIDPELAYSIYILRPAYAQKVANVNPRFAIALAEVKAAIEEQKRLEEEAKNDNLTADTDNLTAPESDTAENTVSSDDTESNAISESDTDIITDDISAPVTEAVPAESATEAENVTDTEAISDTDIDADTGTDIDTDTDAYSGVDTDIATEIGSDTEKPVETTAVPTTASDPNILVIERTLNLRRYAFGHRELSSTDSLEYNWAKVYNYSEGRAAVVDDNGILYYIDTAGEIVIDGTGTKMVTASRYITTEYAEPLYRWGEESKGYLYFDEGLVRVRRLERDYTYRNLIYSDSDVLLYKDGSEYELPHGYTLTAYSEGVLVLEGQNGKFGYYHKDGYWIAQPVYTEIRPFSEGLGVLGFEGGKKGVIDIEGNIVVPFAYEYITAPSSGILTLYSYEGGWKVLLKMIK